MLENPINNNREQGKEKPSIKEGVDFVFEQNPELSTIGTKEQYEEYIETIFPESVAKGEIFQHQTKNDFDIFSDEKNSSGRLGDGHYFSNFGNDFIDNKFDSIKKVVCLDIKNPKIIQGGGYMKEVYSIMNERGLNIDDSEERKRIQNEYTNNLKKSYDALIGDKNGKLNSEILVFNSSQIHILGSQKDVEDFKNFIESKK